MRQVNYCQINFVARRYVLKSHFFGTLDLSRNFRTRHGDWGYLVELISAVWPKKKCGVDVDAVKLCATVNTARGVDVDAVKLCATVNTARGVGLRVCVQYIYTYTVREVDNTAESNLATEFLNKANFVCESISIWVCWFSVSRFSSSGVSLSQFNN